MPARRKERLTSVNCSSRHDGSSSSSSRHHGSSRVTQINAQKNLLG
jgi:hypothetical protein